MSALTDERDFAFAVSERAMREIRLCNAIIRDTFLTAAEQSTRMSAYVECLDRHAPEEGR